MRVGSATSIAMTLAGRATQKKVKVSRLGMNWADQQAVDPAAHFDRPGAGVEQVRHAVNSPAPGRPAPARDVLLH